LTHARQQRNGSMMLSQIRLPGCASVQGAQIHGRPCSRLHKAAQPCRRHQVLRASDDNCITAASTASIIKDVGGGAGGSGGSGKGGSGGGGGDAGKDAGDNSVPHPMRAWTFALAALVAVGGIIGFVKKGSNKSLGGGLSTALILGMAARSMVGASAPASVRVAFAITFLLGVFFASRFASSKKIMPGGVGAGLCLSYAVAYVATGL